MKSTVNLRLKHFIVIGITFIVFWGLLTIDRTSIQTSKTSIQNDNDNRNTNSSLSIADESVQKELEQLENKFKNENLPSKKLEILNQLVALSLSKNLLVNAVDYQRKIVNISRNPADIIKLGELALMGLDNVTLDSLQYVTMHSTAQESFKELLEKEPDNTNWIVKMALTKVKSRDSGIIMEGIRDLVSITQKDGNHFEANFYLGLFSLESNQPQKALKRFEKCLSLQPQNVEVLLGLGDAYRMLNQKQQAFKYYQEALAYTTNEIQKSKIKSKIELLKH